MKLTPNFTLEEFTRSHTATVLNLRNDPTPSAMVNLHYLALWLQQLRDQRIHQPIIITSGYRNEEVNRAVGGSPTSDHMTGLAADIKVVGVEPLELVDIITSVPYLWFDQLISYSEHVHVGLGSRRRGSISSSLN